MVPFLTRFFRKKTHMEQYLHADSHHFLAQKFGVLCTLATREFGVLCTLATRALRICDDSALELEKTHLLDFFESNGYNRSHGLKAFRKAYKGLTGKST